MKTNNLLLLVLVLSTALYLPLTAMESTSKRQREEKSNEPAEKRQRVSLPERMSEIANPELGYFNPVPKSVIVNAIIPYLKGTTQKAKSVPELFEMARKFVNLKRVSKFFYAMVNELNLSINLNNQKEKNQLCERVNNELNQYVASHQHLDLWQGGGAFILASRLRDKKFLDRYLPVMNYLGFTDSLSQATAPNTDTRVAQMCSVEEIESLFS